MTHSKNNSFVHISVRGVVQGVGFRPFVYQLAAQCGLKGWVCNTSGDVKIEIEGESAKIEVFLKDLRAKAPIQSRIEDITATPGTPSGYDNFEIRPSLPQADTYQLVSPDIATCPQCLHEIFDPFDRRYRYPFTNCTNCGPRFTIIDEIPYDRPNTTMRDFTMCPDCQAEYEDPENRRFHAQPNACPDCGPKLTLTDAAGTPVDCDEIDIVRWTARLLKDGKIVAVKGLGGFLLACDAANESAVNTLRERKHRPAKPFAVMVASLLEARKHCEISGEEEKLLSSAASPIVLLKWKPESAISKAVAPGLKYLGVMLPYTPLHHLLIRDTGRPLVMTSGNLSEEPIVKDNDEALRRLNNIADYFLLHNRNIYARYDDSVTLVEAGSPRIIRRARGYAPYPIKLPFKSAQILGCGAEEKNTFCLTRDNYAFISQHIGDMENMETMEHYVNALELYKKIFRINPQIIAFDIHPEYLPTKYAKELAEKEKLQLVPVQHHHAHIAACMAENGLSQSGLAEYGLADRVIGVALDGTGYGTDGKIWGGEFLTADFKGFTRQAHLEYLPLPGGTLAVKKPYRTAAGYLLALGIPLDKNLPLMQYISDEELAIVREQVNKKLNAPLTSSMGRLFDAVAALTGVRGVIDYEAQAAIDLETCATAMPGETSTYPFSIAYENGMRIIKVHELFTLIIKDLHDKISKEVIASRFHNTIARLALEVCQDISRKTRLKKTALSGGVFQNRLLFRKSVELLESAGFEVYTHHQVPCNDGGISLGQVAVANASSNYTLEKH
jgi:hydrogenase maturation protein HypF